jgi:hypothetical protein
LAERKLHWQAHHSRLRAKQPSREIVGVVGDVRPPTIYVPHLQQSARWLGPGWGARSGMYFTLRTTGDPLKLVSAMRQALADVDLDKPASAVQTVRFTAGYFRSGGRGPWRH